MQVQQQARQWQTEAASFFYESGGSCIFECATGSGKTHAAILLLSEVLANEPEIRALIIVPKNVILERTWYTDLYDYGFSLKDIGVYYSLAKEPARVTITNMQNVYALDMEQFDFVIFDEVHNYATDRLIPLVNEPFKYKLGLSATVDRSCKKGWKLLECFGYNVFKYSPGDAIKDGVLNTFDVINIGVELGGEVKEKYEDLTRGIRVLQLKLDSFWTERDELARLRLVGERKRLVYNYTDKFDAVVNICAENQTSKIIIFNEFNDTTNKLYWRLLDIGVKSRVVHSSVPKEDVNRYLDEFRDDVVRVICTTRMLDEGYNLPKIDIAIIMAGTGTQRQTVQRMGRVLRKKDVGSKLYQVYCIGTMEERSAISRGQMFRKLCVNYTERIHKPMEAAAACQ